MHRNWSDGGASTQPKTRFVFIVRSSSSRGWMNDVRCNLCARNALLPNRVIRRSVGGFYGRREGNFALRIRRAARLTFGRRCPQSESHHTVACCPDGSSCSAAPCSRGPSTRSTRPAGWRWTTRCSPGWSRAKWSRRSGLWTASCSMVSHSTRSSGCSLTTSFPQTRTRDSHNKFGLTRTNSIRQLKTSN